MASDLTKLRTLRDNLKSGRKVTVDKEGKIQNGGGVRNQGGGAEMIPNRWGIC